MIDMATLSRVRLSGGRAIHAVAGPTTRCRKRVVFDAATYGRADTPLAPETPVTCRSCLAALDGEEAKRQQPPDQPAACPVPCDADCDADCHDLHVIPRLREGCQRAGCPAQHPEGSGT